jgi:hypothetical protein
MEVTSSSNVSAPPKPRAPERNRAAEYRAEQEQLQQRAQRQEAGNRPKEPVVNPQGQTTGRLVNEKA